MTTAKIDCYVKSQIKQYFSEILERQAICLTGIVKSERMITDTCSSGGPNRLLDQSIESGPGKLTAAAKTLGNPSYTQGEVELPVVSDRRAGRQLFTST